jgi:hypothetical protein
MGLAIFIVSLVVLDLLAWKFGVDSTMWRERRHVPGGGLDAGLG